MTYQHQFYELKTGSYAILLLLKLFKVSNKFTMTNNARNRTSLLS